MSGKREDRQFFHAELSARGHAYLKTRAKAEDRTMAATLRCLLDELAAREHCADSAVLVGFIDPTNRGS